MHIALDLFWLVFAHTLADFGFQNRWMADNKGSFKWLMTAHCIIYTGIVMFMFVLLGKDIPIFIPAIFSFHFIIDELTCSDIKRLRELGRPDRELSVAVIGDQVLHILLLIGLYFTPVS